MKRYGKDNARTQVHEQELARCFLELRLSPKFTEILTDNLRVLIEQMRGAERRIMELCVKDAKMPAQALHQQLSGQRNQPAMAARRTEKGSALC